MLTKWELTKWEVDKVGIDEVKLTKWELTKWELTKWEDTTNCCIQRLTSNQRQIAKAALCVPDRSQGALFRCYFITTLAPPLHDHRVLSKAGNLLRSSLCSCSGV